ncbi:hypothetical protein BpHYR1_037626 [Brachionus plicatilis]|uniref:Uncharacterized protein n=1 Tax=Brachionus plicatilis TaxID=10195 RepID=A0A3M7RYM2_BRAPC|nr:hypothetical protein BpHYR1_037626 [Brachionus plicatilis]
MGNIHFVQYCYKSNVIKSFRSKDFVFESFKLNKDKLLGCDVVNFKLVCFDLKKAIENNSFNDSFFIIDFAKSKDIQHYGLSLSNKNIYLIEKKKNLRFFDVINADEFKAKQTANLTLYVEATSVLCSNEFISLSMKDKKVISFLISDKDNFEETNKQIKNLPHFGKLDKEIEKKNDLIIRKCIDLLDNKTLSIEQIFNSTDQINIEIKERLNKAIENINPLNIFIIKKNFADLKSNWLLDILNNDLGFNVKQYTKVASSDNFQTTEENLSETRQNHQLDR